MRPDHLKGHLDGLLLAVLEDGPAHGYALIEEMRRRSGGTFDLPEGTVYPALHRLEAAGLVASRSTTVNGRARRVYRVTRSGTRALAESREDWRRFSSAVGAVLKVAPA
ncbi:MAG TPA: helix-turn-helix transcriptional regulator [Acidimicrobiales bacterium]|jgi:DNA-binding PadR family transcriptional regulator